MAFESAKESFLTGSELRTGVSPLAINHALLEESVFSKGGKIEIWQTNSWAILNIKLDAA